MELRSQYETLVENFPGGVVFLVNASLEYVRPGGKELKTGLSADDVNCEIPHTRSGVLSESAHRFRWDLKTHEHCVVPGLHTAAVPRRVATVIRIAQSGYP
jgi:hypothetical protein